MTNLFVSFLPLTVMVLSLQASLFIMTAESTMNLRFPPAQRSIGGMKFVIELGYWLTAEERDAIADTVEKVTFTNVTKETKYIIRDVFKYFYLKRVGAYLQC